MVKIHFSEKFSPSREIIIVNIYLFVREKKISSYIGQNIDF